MKAQLQTTFGEEGNCWSTCIAIILGLDVAEVPNFVLEKLWMKATREWLAARGFVLLDSLTMYPPSHTNIACEPLLQLGCASIASGPGPRGRHHAVVYSGDKLFCDPHPSNAGLLSVERHYFLIHRGAP